MSVSVGGKLIWVTKAANHCRYNEPLSRESKREMTAEKNERALGTVRFDFAVCPDKRVLPAERPAGSVCAAAFGAFLTIPFVVDVSKAICLPEWTVERAFISSSVSIAPFFVVALPSSYQNIQVQLPALSFHPLIPPSPHFDRPL